MAVASNFRLPTDTTKLKGFSNMLYNKSGGSSSSVTQPKTVFQQQPQQQSGIRNNPVNPNYVPTPEDIAGQKTWTDRGITGWRAPTGEYIPIGHPMVVGASPIYGGGTGGTATPEMGGAFESGGGSVSATLPGDMSAQMWLDMLKAQQVADLTTEQRALADRQSALDSINAIKNNLYGTQAWKDIETQRQELVSNPTLSQTEVDRQYGVNRDIAEAQAADAKRKIQESFYGGIGAPSGAMAEQMSIADVGKTGILTQRMADLMKEKSLQDRADREKNIALAMQQAGMTYGVESDVGKDLADIYSNIIAAPAVVGEQFKNPGDTSWSTEWAPHKTEDGKRYYYDMFTGTWKEDPAEHKIDFSNLQDIVNKIAQDRTITA